MAFCGNCGTQVQEGINFCPSCGKEVTASPTQPQQQPILPNDTQTNKVMAVLAYIIFFIPIITGDHKKSPFVKYHVNQGILVFILGFAYSIISTVLSSVIKVRRDYGFGFYTYHTPIWLVTILWLGSLSIFALSICGIYNAVNGKTKPLPIIGGLFTFFK